MAQFMYLQCRLTFRQFFHATVIPVAFDPPFFYAPPAPANFIKTYLNRTSPRYNSDGYYATIYEHEENAKSMGTQEVRLTVEPAFRVRDLEDGVTYNKATHHATRDSNTGSLRPGTYGPPSSSESSRHQRTYYRSSYSTSQRFCSTSASTQTRMATRADARKHHLPSGASLTNWDPSEEPFIVFDIVFDANSLGKCVYDGTLKLRGPQSPLTNMAGELWMLLIKISGYSRKAQSEISCIRQEKQKDVVNDFIKSADMLLLGLKDMLRTCEKVTVVTWHGVRGHQSDVEYEVAGLRLTTALFEREQLLRLTEQFMTSVRLWKLRFDAKWEEIVRL